MISRLHQVLSSYFRPLHGLKEVARFGGSAILEQPTEEVVPGVGIA